MLVLFFLASWPLALSALVSELLTFGLGLTGFLFLLGLTDWTLTPSRRRLVVSRHGGSNWQQGEERRVRIRIENTSASTTVIEIEDPPPAPLEAERERLVVRLSGSRHQQATYRVRAARRGTGHWSGFAIRARGPLGLVGRAWWQSDLVACRVLPELFKLPTVGRPVRGKTPRGRRSFVPERGDFDRLREYCLGDDPRVIDWKATSRRRSLVVRQFVPPRNERLMLVLDVGYAMGAPTGERTKLDHACSAAAALATAAIRAGDEVGLVTFAGEIVTTLGPGHGMRHLRRLLQELADSAAKTSASLVPPALARARRLARRRALVVLITDVADEREAVRLRESLQPRGARALPICVLISDECLNRWARDEPETIRDAYRRVASGTVLAERERALGALRRGGVLTVDGAAGQLSSELLDTYARIKARALV
ncbi:MAG: DUF58 domain-containing protein [Planctomycetota bacterium]